MKIKKEKMTIQEVKYLFIANNFNILISNINEIFFIDIDKYMKLLSKETIYDISGLLLDEKIIGYSLYPIKNTREQILLVIVGRLEKFKKCYISLDEKRILTENELIIIKNK